MRQIRTKGIADLAITNAKLADGSVSSAKLDSSALTGVLASKDVAFRVAVTGLEASGGSTAVSTEIEGVASTFSPITALTEKGVYVGAVSGATDIKKVLIRAAGSDNGIDDGSGDEVYGVLSESSGVYTLTYYDHDGVAYSFATPTNIDFYFVEVFDLSTAPVDRFLMSPVGGVIDATTASALVTHAGEAVVGAHKAVNISYDRLDASKKNVQEASDEVEAALTDLDDTIGSLAASPANYTPTSAAIVADHLAAIDSALGDTADAAYVGTANVTPTNYTQSAETIAGHLDGIDTVLGSLQTECDLNQGAIGSFIDGDGNVVGFSGTNYLDAEASLTTAFEELDAQIANIAAGLVTSFSDADFEIYSDAAPTKRVSFNVSDEVSAGQDRIITVPDRDVNLGKVLDSGTETITLTPADIAAGYVGLTANVDVINPELSYLNVYGVEADYTDDYTIVSDGTYIRRITWAGTLAGLLEAGDVLKIRYSKY